MTARGWDWTEGAGKDSLAAVHREPRESVDTASLSREQLVRTLAAAREGARTIDRQRRVAVERAEMAEERLAGLGGLFDSESKAEALAEERLLQMGHLRQRAEQAEAQVADLKRVNHSNRLTLIRANLLDSGNIDIEGVEAA